MIDSELVRQAQLGSREAMEEICRREWRAVYDLVYRTVQNRAEAQDLTQDVFLRALRSFGRYHDTGRPVHSYFVTIALNLLRDRHRSRVPATLDVDDLLLLSSEPGPEQLVLADLDRALIRDALETLPSDYQTVIRLRVVETRSSQEVAELMGRNADAVRQLQRRALQALRAALLKDSLT
jgi:RNA polymerase sigma-70 factor (ECF subfamily)